MFDSRYYIYCKLRSLNPLFFGVGLNSFPLDQFIKVPGTLIPTHPPVNYLVLIVKLKGSVHIFSSVQFDGDSSFILVHGVVHGQIKLGIAVEQNLHPLHFLKLFDRNFRFMGNVVSNLTLTARN